MFYGYYGMGFIIIGAAISLIASWNVKATFKRYSKSYSSNGLTGAEAAQNILRNAGITDVSIERISGNLTDHYDPTSKKLRLSDSVYSSSSMAAVGVAAHECGHAIQHNENYIPNKIRGSLVPVANIGSALSMPIVLIGIYLQMFGLAEFGIYLFCAIILFQLVTLPVEFNASFRAVRILDGMGNFSTDEMSAVKKVLTAAALTYVAAILVSVLQLIRLIGIVNGGKSRR